MSTFSYKQSITIADIDSSLQLSNKGILRILQETANLASSQIGHGINDIERTGTTWVLLYWKVNIIKRLKYNDEIEIETWCNFQRNLTSIRNFIIYYNGEIVIQASSKWVFVDAKKHNILKIPNDLIQKYGNDTNNVFTEKLNEKIKLPENTSLAFTYTTMLRDLDANQHVNNSEFLEIAIEALPEQIQRTNFGNIEIVFKKEILHKHTINCYYIYENNIHEVYLYNATTDTLSGVVRFF